MGQTRVDRRLMGEQAEAPAAQEPETVVEEDLEAGLDARHCGRV
jgi:hypothetical protein